MGNEGGTTEPHNFAFGQFQHFQEENPEIVKIVGKIMPASSGLSPHDFLVAISVLFEGLQVVARALGHELPRISANSANRARIELCEAEDNVLDRSEFFQFRDTIKHEFRPKLEGGKVSDHVRKLVEHTFAIILKAIKIELTRSKESRTAD